MAIPIEQVRRPRFEDTEFRLRLNDFSWVLLAEGDSWFSYGSTKWHNVLEPLALSRAACVLNLATPGDTLRRMHDTVRNPELFFYLMNRGGRRWSGILLSGGGNDLIDAAWDGAAGRSRLLLQVDRPQDIDEGTLDRVVDEDALAALLDYVRRNVEAIIDQGRDRAGSNSVGVPLFLHTYALVQPRNAPVLPWGGPGPWLFPACRWTGLAPELWLPLSALLLRRLAGCLSSITRPNVHVIDTLAAAVTTPAPAGTRGNTGDWDNEIHPNATGYARLAPVWAATLEQHLP